MICQEVTTNNSTVRRTVTSTVTTSDLRSNTDNNEIIMWTSTEAPSPTPLTGVPTLQSSQTEIPEPMENESKLIPQLQLSLSMCLAGGGYWLWVLFIQVAHWISLHQSYTRDMNDCQSSYHIVLVYTWSLLVLHMQPPNKFRWVTLIDGGIPLYTDTSSTVEQEDWDWSCCLYCYVLWQWQGKRSLTSSSEQK